WWQSIKEDWRKQIYINNEATIEQDYSGLHVNLLYDLQGLEPQRDPVHIRQSIRLYRRRTKEDC
ncbi:MAG: hypothetical protein ACKVJK_15530, partial [Methylophagaceae bacterium]